MNVYVALVTLLSVTCTPLQTLLQALLRLGPEQTSTRDGRGIRRVGLNSAELVTDGFFSPRRTSDRPSLVLKTHSRRIDFLPKNAMTAIGQRRISLLDAMYRAD